MAIGGDTAYARLRRDVGADDQLLDNPTAELYFVESDEKYPGDTAKMTAYTRVIALRGILADAAKLGRYVQNQSEEDFRTVFNNLTKLLEYWENQVAIAADPSDENTPSAVFFTVAQGQRGR